MNTTIHLPVEDEVSDVEEHCSNAAAYRFPQQNKKMEIKTVPNQPECKDEEGDLLIIALSWGHRVLKMMQTILMKDSYEKGDVAANEDVLQKLKTHFYFSF